MAWSDHPFYQSWAKKIGGVFAAIATKLGTYIAIAALIVLTLSVMQCRARAADARAKAAESAEAQAKLEAVLKDFAAVKGQLANEREMSAALNDRLKKFVAAAQKADPKATIESVHTDKITIKDTDTGVVTQVAGSPCPTEVVDRHNRFHFDLPSGLLHRSQSFKATVVSIRGLDGSYRIADSDFREYDPVTGEEIPTEGLKVESTFKFGEEKLVASPWHPRIVAGIAAPFGVGLGVQVNPWKWLVAGALVMYQPTPKVGLVAVSAGYRLFGSTVAVGPFVGVNTKGSIVGGGLATIELTR